MAVFTPLTHALLIIAAGTAAGIVNGVAGGGTFLAFPALLWSGLGSLTANMTASIGLMPSYLGGIRGFRQQLTSQRHLLSALLPWCVAGSLTGCALLIAFPERAFNAVLPFLVGGGTLLFAFAPLITRRLAHIDRQHPGRRRVLCAGVYFVAVYGGYFGAGLGILLLAVMAVTLRDELPTLQGLRNALSLVINVTAAVVFTVRGHADFADVGYLLVGSLAGGIIGTSLLQRLSPVLVRSLVVALGALTTAKLAL